MNGARNLTGTQTTAARAIGSPIVDPGSRGLPLSTSLFNRTGQGLTITDAAIQTPGPSVQIDQSAISRALAAAGVPTTPENYASLFPASVPPAGSQAAPTDGTTIGTTQANYADQYGFPGALADLFLRTFDTSGSTTQPQAPVVVGDASYAQPSGSSNTLLIVLILAGVGAAGYYFFVRKKGGD